MCKVGIMYKSDVEPPSGKKQLLKVQDFSQYLQEVTLFKGVAIPLV